MIQRFHNASAAVHLRRQWAAAGIVGALALTAAGGVLATRLSVRLSLTWLLASGAALTFLMVRVRRHLHLNQRADGVLAASLGPANRITLVRGVLISAIIGFVFLPRSMVHFEILKWVPGTVYILAALLDLLDGWTARKTGTATELGRRLDTEFDALAVLSGAGLALRWGKASVVFVLVGLAYYLFRLACRRRRRRGLPVSPLPPSRIRRPLAGSAMGVAGIVLLPPVPAEIARILTLAVAVPFLANFVYDYIAVTRRGDARAP